MLEYLYPGSIKLDRLDESDDWFKETAKDTNVEIGKRITDICVKDIVDMIKGK